MRSASVRCAHTVAEHPQEERDRAMKSDPDEAACPEGVHERLERIAYEHERKGQNETHAHLRGSRDPQMLIHGTVTHRHAATRWWPLVL